MVEILTVTGNGRDSDRKVMIEILTEQGHGRDSDRERSWEGF